MNLLVMPHHVGTSQLIWRANSVIWFLCDGIIGLYELGILAKLRF